MPPFGGLPRVLTPVEARRRGISKEAVRHRVRIRSWRVLARGYVLTTAGPPTRDDWAMVGLLAAGPEAALSGWDAIRLHGIGPDRPTTPEVLVLTHGGANRRLGRALVRPTARPYGSWLLPREHETLPWAQVADHARAVADTALTAVRVDDVRALVAASVQRRACTPDQLACQLAEMPRGGSASFRRAVEEVLDGARSVAEATAASRLRAAKVASFELNVPVLSVGGVEVANLDVLWRRLRAVLEVDSRRYHWDDERAFERTLARHNRLNRVGFVVEHHTPKAIAAGGPLWAPGVDAWLRGRAAELGLLYEPGNGPIRAGDGGPAPVRLRIIAAAWARLAPPSR